MTQPFTQIDIAKTRYEVVVIHRNATYGCDRCDENLEANSFVCPCCHRTCCEECIGKEAAHLPHFHGVNPWICRDCDSLPIEIQLQIAAFSAELNK